MPKWCPCFGGDASDNDKSDQPPLLSPNNSSNLGVVSPSSPSPRAVRGRNASSANEYLSRVVNLCKIGQGTFAAVSLVIDRAVLESLDDTDSSISAFYAVKRISRRGEASRLGPGEGGAVAERKTHAVLEHPFFPVLHSASRSSQNFYIAFPFALGGDVSKALARRANSIRGFDKQVAQALHAQAQVGGTLAGMNAMIAEGQQQQPQQQQMANPFGNNAGNGSGKKKKSAGVDDSKDYSLFNTAGTPDGELRATQQGLPIGFVVFVAYELLSAIAFLNDKGYTHYDIRPGNLLLCDGGHVILGDFGMIRDESGRGTNGAGGGQRGGSDATTDSGMFGKMWKALGGGGGGSSSSNAHSTGAAPAANNDSFASGGNVAAPTTTTTATSPHKNRSFGSSPASPSGPTETANEKRSQLYLAPEHLNSASNAEAEHDQKRLSDVWSYGVLLLELALGAHPFAPASVQGSPAGESNNSFAMLSAIKRMQFKRVPTAEIHSEPVAHAVDLLNDLAAKIFVPRAQRLSASQLMQHKFFSAPEVRALVVSGGAAALEQQSLAPAAEPMNTGYAVAAAAGSAAVPAVAAAADTKIGAASNTDFFEYVVNRRLLQCPESLHPGRVCLRGGCPKAGQLKHMLSTIAPCPNHVAPQEFAPTLNMQALGEEVDSSCELIDLRFFGSLSEKDLDTWCGEDNDQCLMSYDQEWAPDDMKCSRKAAISSHASFGGGSTLGGGRGGGGGDGGREGNKGAAALPEPLEFTFARPPRNTSFGSARG